MRPSLRLRYPTVTRLTALGLAGLVASTAAASLVQQAADARAKAVANIAALSTLDVETRTTHRTVAGGQTGPEQRTSDRVTWQRTQKRLKWTRLDGTVQAYVADGAERTLLLMNGTTKIGRAHV